MKKILTTAIIIGMLTISLTTIVSAVGETQTGAIYEYEIQNIENLDEFDILSEDTGDTDSSSIEDQISEKELKNKKQLKQFKAVKHRKKFRGSWGYTDQNETAGYVSGVIGRKGRVGYLKGIWNNTGNDKNGRVVGFLKRGYFNGKIMTEDGACRITGLYKINKEKQSLNLRWMTANKVGWAHLQIKLI